MADDQFDYIVVGSGAGGGPVAANIARAGHRVLLLESGEDDGDREEYRVPGFHPHASEDPEMRWDFFVSHFSDPAKNSKTWDPKYHDGEVSGILYPRASTLGGCTAHNALITLAAYPADWEQIARMTSDDSWKAEKMHEAFTAIEQCRYRTRPVSPHYAVNRSRHGFDGWLPTELPAPENPALQEILERVTSTVLDDGLLPESANPTAILLSYYRDDPLRTAQVLAQLGNGGRKSVPEEAVIEAMDPNDWRALKSEREGLYRIPIATGGAVRHSTRELLRNTAREHPNLKIQTSALATRIVIEDGRAVGVTYLDGPRLYRADRDPGSLPTADATERTASAKREIILSAGVFNTPQLLMLSGVGPEPHLESMGIRCVRHLAGVGSNLQDRYEVAVVTQLDGGAAGIVGDCRLRPPRNGEEPDECLRQWNDSKTGIYTSNGALLGVIRRSKPERPHPDLFLMGLMSDFAGYEPGYADKLRPALSWAILKAYTENTAGTVRLRSRDPRAPPDINFSYFEEGNDRDGKDLESLVEGIKFARRINAGLAARGLSLCESLPGPDIGTDAEIADYVRRTAWGHHGCGTCRIGRADDECAVVDSDFRVHGIPNLRIVDASVFPRIPGFFIAAPIFTIAEKASKAILSSIPSS